MRDPATAPASPIVQAYITAIHTPGPSPPTEPAIREAAMQSPRESAKPRFPLPKLRLEVRDLNHRGADTFLSSVHAGKALAVSVQNVLSLLYQSPASQTTTPPPTRSVTLILRPMDGIAYSTGTELDSDHKEIHMSLDYIHGIDASRSSDEILGVLTHEMVHCFQHNAFGTCPGGLIEGVADWVRMHSGLGPPHWKRVAGQKWDAGYEHTAYFLEYLETRVGAGFVRRLNEKLRIRRYEEKWFWTELCGKTVEELWSDYQKIVEEETKIAEECIIVEKEDATGPMSEPTPMVH